MMNEMAIYLAMALTFIAGIMTAILVGSIRKSYRAYKATQPLPEYDPNNPLNGGYRPGDVIHTEEGITLYRIRPPREV